MGLISTGILIPKRKALGDPKLATGVVKNIRAFPNYLAKQPENFLKFSANSFVLFQLFLVVLLFNMDVLRYSIFPLCETQMNFMLCENHFGLREGCGGTIRVSVRVDDPPKPFHVFPPFFLLVLFFIA